MMKKRRKVVKKRKIETKEDIRLQKYQQVNKLSKKINARLKSLEKVTKTGTWASKKLKNRLSIKKIKSFSKGRVNVNKKLSITDLKLIEKALNQFLVSKTSTKKGIKDAKQNVKDSIKRTLNEESFNLTDEDADMFYSMLEDNDFTYFSDKVGSSTIWALIDDAIEHNYSCDDFINRVEKYILTTNDLDSKDILQRLYNKYIRK